MSVCYKIRKLTDNSEVDFEKLDQELRKEFSLTDHCYDKPYGHFYYEEAAKAMNLCEESISWVALLHIIFYGCSMHYGRNSQYEVEAAIAWIDGYGLVFPQPVWDFATKLTRYLHQQGLYIFICYNRDDVLNKNEYVNYHQGNSILKNDSGYYEYNNADYRLMSFCPSINNLLNASEERVNNKYRLHVRSLMIPQGVSAIDRGFFNYGYIQESVVFPASLRTIDSFQESNLPDIVIPENVENIASGAFMNSIIRSVKFLRLFENKNDNSHRPPFSGARVQTLFLPIEYKQKNSWIDYLFPEREREFIQRLYIQFPYLPYTEHIEWE